MAVTVFIVVAHCYCCFVVGFGKRVNSWSTLVRLMYKTLYRTSTRMTLWLIILHSWW